MNAGMGGATTDNIISGLSAVTISKPQKIFLMIGINDFLAHDRNVSYILTNYETILNQIRSESPDTVVYIESVLPINTLFTSKSTIKMPANTSSKIVTLNDKLKSLARGDKIIFINLYPSFCGSDNQLYIKYTVDGFHLDPAGYAVWKNLISQYVINASQAVTFTFNTPAPAGSMYAGTIWAEYRYATDGPWYLLKVANVTLEAV
jgi:lysophospholipase L1-like esterase